jgi:hypothetical protein
MGRWLLLALVLVVLGLFVHGQVAVWSSDSNQPEPEAAPDWIAQRLGGLLLPLAPELDPADVAAQDGLGWRYDPPTARLSLAAGSDVVTASLRLPPEEAHSERGDHGAHGGRRRIAELVEVGSAGSDRGPVAVRIVVEGSEEPDFAPLKDGRMTLAVPPAGARLELRSKGPRAFLLR